METNVFAKFEGPAVDGGATAKGHEKDLELYSWNHGFSLPVSFAPDSRVMGTVNNMDVGLTFELNSATVPMLKSVFTGSNFDTVTIFCYRSSGEDTLSKQQLYMKVILTEAICSSVSLAGSTGDTGTVSITLNYSKIQYEYDPQKSDSSATGKKVISYDLKTTKKA